MGYYELKAKAQKLRITEQAYIRKGYDAEAKKLRTRIDKLQRKMKELGVPKNVNPYVTYKS